jgi:hypothetical protein
MGGGCSLIRDALFRRKSSHAHAPGSPPEQLASLGGADVYLSFFPLEDEMNKNKTKDQERKPRLSLKRETILLLNSALLRLARGARNDEPGTGTCNTSSSFDPDASSQC